MEKQIDLDAMDEALGRWRQFEAALAPEETDQL